MGNGSRGGVVGKAVLFGVEWRGFGVNLGNGEPGG